VLVLERDHTVALVLALMRPFKAIMSGSQSTRWSQTGGSYPDLADERQGDHDGADDEDDEGGRPIAAVLRREIGGAGRAALANGEEAREQGAAPAGGAAAPQAGGKGGRSPACDHSCPLRAM
jgi:hypothetical protein